LITFAATSFDRGFRNRFRRTDRNFFQQPGFDPPTAWRPTDVPHGAQVMDRFHWKPLRAAGLVLAVALLQGANDPAGGRLQAQGALKPYGGLVGSWRGTGQPERGKARGSWTEKGEWSWKLTKETAALEASFERDKYLKSVVLRPGPEPGTFALDAVLADGSKRTFTGKDNGRKPAGLMLSAGPGEGVRRITLTPLHDTRLLMMLEAQDPSSKIFSRIAEVGYTREGIAFAAEDTGPVCIVTEGRGSIPVTYKGKTYYVCCTGCRDLFNDDPDAVLAEAAEREKSRKKN
jgi:YHS domain-containing protein